MDPLLNAVIEDRFEAALEDAKLIDKKLSESDVSKDEKQLEREQPLLGKSDLNKSSHILHKLLIFDGSLYVNY